MSLRHSLLASLSLTLAACGGSVVSPTNGAANDAGAGDIGTVLPDVVTTVDLGDPGRDLPPTIDAPTTADLGTPIVDVPAVDTRVPRCGDTVLDPGESCDDGNNRDGDGCSAACRFEMRCGDGRVGPGEVCDDGNNRSGDGCRSDCLSNETCGNRIVDISRGEVCDGTPNCGPDCRTITSCGDGRVGAGEQCDDGNQTRWDGCGPDCRVEQATVLNRLQIAADNGRVGCDFSGDRVPDNAFGRALGSAVGILNSFITSPISNGQILIQLSFLNLTDPRGQNLPNTRVGWLLGADADGMVQNNGTPGNAQFVQRGSLNAMTLLPQASFQSVATGGMIDGGPEDIELNFGMTGMGNFGFRVQRARISGTVVANDTRIVEFRGGTLCGAIPARDLAQIRNPANMIPGGGGGMNNSTLLEALVGGQRVLILNIGPQQPDVDLDGDGLERYEATMGGLGRPPSITACFDGNGTRIEGSGCVTDPRMNDGFTSAFSIGGPWITLRGVQGGGGGGGTGTVDAGVATPDAGR
jgi:cysteine-rich repeat protein